MKSKSVFREFLKYISLNMLGMVGLSSYIFADTYFIANRFGQDGLSAINLAMPVFGFVLAAGLMLAFQPLTSPCRCSALFSRRA